MARFFLGRFHMTTGIVCTDKHATLRQRRQRGSESLGEIGTEKKGQRRSINPWFFAIAERVNDITGRARFESNDWLYRRSKSTYVCALGLYTRNLPMESRTTSVPAIRTTVAFVVTRWRVILFDRFYHLYGSL